MPRRPKDAPVLSELRQRLLMGLCAVGLFSLVINVLMLTSPLYMLQVYDRVLTSRSGHTLFLLTVTALVVMAIGGILDAIRARVLLRLGMRVSDGLAGQLFDQVVGAEVRGAKTASAQPLRDLDTLRGFLTGPTLATLFDVPWTPIFLAVIVLVHPLLGGVALAGAVVLVTLALLSEFSMRGPSTQAANDQLIAQSFCEGAARNGEVIAAMGMGPALRQRWLERYGMALAGEARSGDRSSAFLSAAKAFRPALQVAMLAAGGYLAIEQTISPGMMIAASIIMGRALAPLEGAIANWQRIAHVRRAYARINEYLAGVTPATEQLSLPRPKGQIVASHLLAAPPGVPQPVIKDVSFSLPAGESLGIIGPSAAGKSTLARLLVGVWQPLAGSIRLDGAEIADWNAAERGPHIGYLPQDVELFEGTIAENIARFGTVLDEKVLEAAMRAGAHEMILHLAEGYQTRIGAGGAGLSGGQRQRIGLARALYGHPALMVLDEPNANLDGDGEDALQSALRALKASGVTTIVIAHRPSVLQMVDRLLVLQDGQVSLYGTREQVLARLPRAIPRQAAPNATPSPSQELALKEA